MNEQAKLHAVAQSTEERAAVIEKQVHSCMRLHEDCRAVIRDMESEYANQRVALIDQHRRRIEDMQADANEQLRSLDDRFKRQIAAARKTLETLVRMRGQGDA